MIGESVIGLISRQRKRRGLFMLIMIKMVYERRKFFYSFHCLDISSSVVSKLFTRLVWWRMKQEINSFDGISYKEFFWQLLFTDSVLFNYTVHDKIRERYQTYTEGFKYTIFELGIMLLQPSTPDYFHKSSTNETRVFI